MGIYHTFILARTKEDGTYIVGNNILIPFLHDYSIRFTKKSKQYLLYTPKTIGVQKTMFQIEIY